MSSPQYQLVGAYAGKTVTLSGYPFVEGVYTHDFEDQTLEGLTLYLARCFNAHPVGSAALADAQATFEAEQSGKAPPVPQAAPPAENSAAVKEAVNGLDHADDAHWTAAGLPSTDAVTDLAGVKVTRADIDAAVPGFNRAAAKAAAAI